MFRVYTSGILYLIIIIFVHFVVFVEFVVLLLNIRFSFSVIIEVSIKYY